MLAVHGLRLTPITMGKKERHFLRLHRVQGIPLPCKTDSLQQTRGKAKANQTATSRPCCLHAPRSPHVAAPALPPPPELHPPPDLCPHHHLPKPASRRRAGRTPRARMTPPATQLFHGRFKLHRRRFKLPGAESSFTVVDSTFAGAHSSSLVPNRASPSSI
jgi:hypothetical protein